jgi:hypothetical protein
MSLWVIGFLFTAIALGALVADIWRAGRRAPYRARSGLARWGMAALTVVAGTSAVMAIVLANIPTDR